MHHSNGPINPSNSPDCATGIVTALEFLLERRNRKRTALQATELGNSQVNFPRQNGRGTQLDIKSFPQKNSSNIVQMNAAQTAAPSSVRHDQTPDIPSSLSVDTASSKASGSGTGQSVSDRLLSLFHQHENKHSKRTRLDHRSLDATYTSLHAIPANRELQHPASCSTLRFSGTVNLSRNLPDVTPVSSSTSTSSEVRNPSTLPLHCSSVERPVGETHLAAESILQAHTVQAKPLILNHVPTPSTELNLSRNTPDVDRGGPKIHSSRPLSVSSHHSVELPVPAVEDRHSAGANQTNVATWIKQEDSNDNQQESARSSSVRRSLSVCSNVSSTSKKPIALLLQCVQSSRLKLKWELLEKAAEAAAAAARYNSSSFSKISVEHFEALSDLTSLLTSGTDETLDPLAVFRESSAPHHQPSSRRALALMNMFHRAAMSHYASDSLGAPPLSEDFLHRFAKFNRGFTFWRELVDVGMEHLLRCWNLNFCGTIVKGVGLTDDGALAESLVSLTLETQRNAKARQPVSSAKLEVDLSQSQVKVKTEVSDAEILEDDVPAMPMMETAESILCIRCENLVTVDAGCQTIPLSQWPVTSVQLGHSLADGRKSIIDLDSGATVEPQTSYLMPGSPIDDDSKSTAALEDSPVGTLVVDAKGLSAEMTKVTTSDACTATDEQQRTTKDASTGTDICQRVVRSCQTSEHLLPPSQRHSVGSQTAELPKKQDFDLASSFESILNQPLSIDSGQSLVVSILDRFKTEADRLSSLQPWFTCTRPFTWLERYFPLGAEQAYAFATVRLITQDRDERLRLETEVLRAESPGDCEAVAFLVRKKYHERVAWLDRIEDAVWRSMILSQTDQNPVQKELLLKMQSELPISSASSPKYRVLKALSEIRDLLLGISLAETVLVGDQFIEGLSIHGVVTACWPDALLDDLFQILDMIVLPTTKRIFFHGGWNDLYLHDPSWVDQPRRLDGTIKMKLPKVVATKVWQWHMGASLKRYFPYREKLSDNVKFYFSEILYRHCDGKHKPSQVLQPGRLSKAQHSVIRTNIEIASCEWFANNPTCHVIRNWPEFRNPALFQVTTPPGRVESQVLSVRGRKLFEVRLLDTMVANEKELVSRKVELMAEVNPKISNCENNDSPSCENVKRNATAFRNSTGFSSCKQETELSDMDLSQ